MARPITTAGRSFRRSLVVFICLVAVAACRAETPGTPVGPTLSPVEAQGWAEFSLHCAPCHATAPDTVIAGPSLAGIGTRAGERIPGVGAEDYIRTSILAPYDYVVDGYTETMPVDFGKRLTGDAFDAVVAYLLTMK
jgi:nitric oxide reductase subunit C